MASTVDDIRKPYVSPAVWVIRCQTRIGSIAGTVNGTVIEPLSNTLTSANSGSHREISSVSSNWPSSHSIIAATVVTGFVIEYSRHNVSPATGVPVSRFARPYVDAWATSPLRPITSCQPASRPSSTYAAKCRSIVASCRGSRPTESGSTVLSMASSPRSSCRSAASAETPAADRSSHWRGGHGYPRHRPIEGADMLADCQLMPFVSTTDLDRARDFYRDVLGLGLG